MLGSMHNNKRLTVDEPGPVELSVNGFTMLNNGPDH